MFCVECGAEGPVYEGLCANCFRKRHPIVAPVEFVDVPRCQSCGSYRLRSGWTKADRDLVIPQLLREAMPPLARSEDPEAFVSRIEEVHGGLDCYVSTNALAKGLARDLAGAFGGTVTASPKLFGQRQGREVYRVTALVRLPAFQKGDVVRHK